MGGSAGALRWLRNGLAGLALLMAVAAVWFGMQIRDLQDRVENGRADLVKAQTFANVDNSVIQLLARAAVEKNDMQIRGLLAANGVTLQLQSGQTPAPGANP